MKVLFVGSHLDKGGGQALQTLQIFRELRKSVDGVYLCLRSGGPHQELHEQEGVRVVGNLRMPQGIRDLRAAIRAERGDWDVVQVFDVYFGLPATYLARAYPRTILFGMDPITEMGWRYGATVRTATRWGLSALLPGTNLLVNSPALAETYRRFSPTFIPNGLDVSRFEALPSRAEARRLLGLDPSAPILLWVGKVVYSKRVEWLFETLRRIPRSIVVAVGGYNEEHFGDRYLRELQERYSDVSARATFTGEVPYAGVSLYLAAADVFAFPSRFEGMPNAVMEAMAARLPVVASDIPAHRALIRPGDTGLLAADPEEFAERITRLLSDPALSARIGQAAREAMRTEFSFAEVSRHYVELYRRLGGHAV
ncbi:MAG: glycosyltransferase family 4 protein [Thermoplasmata archaeon]